MNIRVELNKQKIIQKVTSDRFGLFISNEWKRLIDDYTPRENGDLIGSARKRPWEIEYIQPYSAYMYYGEVYVDPITGISGFMTEEGWKSKRGVKKVPSGRRFQYNQDNSPYATDHWDIKAAENGQLNKLYRTLNNGLQSGNF